MGTTPIVIPQSFSDRGKIATDLAKPSDFYSSPQAAKDDTKNRQDLATESVRTMSDEKVKEYLHPSKPPIRVRGGSDYSVARQARKD